jgi:hypothetical protein
MLEDCCLLGCSAVQTGMSLHGAANQRTDIFILIAVRTWSHTLIMLHNFQENGESCIMGSFIICTHHQILLGRSNEGEWGGQGMWHAWEREETCTGFGCESPKEKYHLEDRGVDGRMVSKWTLGRLVWGVSGFTWLRIGTIGGLLWMRWWTFGFWRHGVS